MDIYQSRLPLILIIILAGVLVVQFMVSEQNGTLIDPQTCELYLKDPQVGGKKYLNEFDSKCLEMKSLNP